MGDGNTVNKFTNNFEANADPEHVTEPVLMFGMNNMEADVHVTRHV